MKLAPTPTSASQSSLGSVRLARALRVGAAALGLALLASSPALAQRQADRNGDGRPDQRAQQDQRPQERPRPPEPQMRDQRFDSREFDDRRQQDPAARAQEVRRAGRLTPDERRDLRRQINEAGIDLYARPPRQ
jgi:hypothetical protein